MARVSPRLISLDIGGTDRSDEVSSPIIKSAKGDRDFMSLTDARSGGVRDYTLEMTVVQDHASGTLWSLIWTGAGTEVSGVYAPDGNETPTVASPHFEFTVRVSEPDGALLGAETTDSLNAVATVEVAWDLVAKPEMVTA